MNDINDWQSKFMLCEYSRKLLNKLIYLNEKSLNKLDLKEISKSIYYAKKYHGNQMRQSGEPYYSHPLEVAYMISDYLFKTDVIIVSVLHDTIEDTVLTEGIITKLFNEEIAKKVDDLTRVKKSGKITSSELIHSLWIQKKYDVLMIKQFDRLHNILTIHSKSPEKISKIVNETLDSFLILSAYLGTRDIEDQFSKLCSDISNSCLSGVSATSSFQDNDLLSLLFQNNLFHKDIQ